MSGATLQSVRELFRFLQGADIKGISPGGRPRLSRRAAFSVIYVLQEHVHALPDTFELCWACDEIFDTYEEGRCDERTGRHYCGNCEDAP